MGDSYSPSVQVIIGTDGDVKWVDVIRSTADQRHSIEAAMRQWKFSPYVTNGRAQEVETDLLIRFTPHGN
jgi:outer membrane biosynthesis protein TonB